VRSWATSKWLIQASPPDRAEPSQRWAFSLYEVLDRRSTPLDPRVLHVTYRGIVELAEEEIPPADDALYTAKLEAAVVEKWKEIWQGHGAR
jgi:hypothetical protein